MPDFFSTAALSVGAIEPFLTHNAEAKTGSYPKSSRAICELQKVQLAKTEAIACVEWITSEAICGKVKEAQGKSGRIVKEHSL